MTLPTTMKGIQLIGHGDQDMLQFSDNIQTPTPKANEVIIKVAAAGVNNTDINTRTAWYSKDNAASQDASWSQNPITFPRIQGADVCGHIVAIGANVDPKRLGQRVLIEPCISEINGETLTNPMYFGSECNGGFAEYTVIADSLAYQIQSDYSDIELASFPCSYSTAENMLDRANVKAEDTVLITGASGGVGSAAVQLVKARGAHVIAVTSSTKLAALTAIGADKAVDRNHDILALLGKNSVDVVIDLVAGNTFTTSMELLKPQGRYVVAGAIGGAMVELDVRTLYLKDLSFFGCTVIGTQVFANLVRLIETKKITPLVDSVYSMDDIKVAQQAFTDKKHIGKIVLENKW